MAHGISETSAVAGGAATDLARAEGVGVSSARREREKNGKGGGGGSGGATDEESPVDLSSSLSITDPLFAFFRQLLLTTPVVFHARGTVEVTTERAMRLL